MGLASWIWKLTDYWEAAQVELHGFYSAERVREFIRYNQETSTLRALLVLVLMPWPCVIITILVDLIPLRPPAEGLDANYLFVLRVFLSFLVASIVVFLQFRHSIPATSLSNLRVFITSIITAAQTTGALYGLSRIIGFPLPFGIITVSPAWVAFLLLPLASFLRRARSDPELWPLVVNSLKVWVCQESLVVIYPTYFYIFTTLSAEAKTYFAFLLPIIKMILRNVMSRTVVHLNDEIPEVVLMNVEVFNSLFMSYCMQNTPSIWTTLGLIAIDGAQMIASMHDVGNVIKRMESVRNRVAAERSRQAGEDISVLRLREIQRGTILGYTMDILERHKLGQSPTVEVAPFIIGPSSTEVVPFDARAKQPAMVMVRSKPKFGARKVFSSANADVTSLEVNYALNVRKVLYITEFVILINYVEVIVPIIFSANLLVMYHLPNRVYYSQIARMDDEKLRKTIENVTLYCVLQLVSLVILFLVLWRRLRISGLRQLAFVLEKQGEQVQTKLILWVFYNVQATLQHFASDYTFKFAWLSGTRP
ncbi:hypothetical protein PC116_g14788 [Phytophthora cactorum]|uniref:Transmembrane protein n=1 Tax=Phytophthora cactorum TaxID=29920 RepID=A0A329SWZ0_9STRA|nr:hypothetical protein Pcac1_g22421 [Phytophthora cactorum]KAG2819258.1 hypothetical protein PC112_g12248 [Phytophthora cactorum]KAG2900892.1 hypothetical protein PC114_g13396 [Phytophthora cactorum]KAG2932916.1 hypothetical protein PC117_g12986 [Phytophthora cactorum]KAG3011422.1 hypothetical protein PC119_g13233 [Phytophthora cactorum]